VGELFGKPKVLAEAIIHHGRANLGIVALEDMKPYLERFFKPGVMALKPYQEIFGLDVPRLYEEAFKRLSVVSQFWRRLTGSYRIQAEEFRVLSLPRDRRESTRPTLSGIQIEEVPLEKLSPEELKARKEEWKRRKHAGAHPKKGSDKASDLIPKEYSEGERNKAWTSFKETIVTKE
jgi:hypothetical protein